MKLFSVLFFFAASVSVCFPFLPSQASFIPSLQHETELSLLNQLQTDIGEAASDRLVNYEKHKDDINQHSIDSSFNSFDSFIQSRDQISPSGNEENNDDVIVNPVSTMDIVDDVSSVAEVDEAALKWNPLKTLFGRKRSSSRGVDGKDIHLAVKPKSFKKSAITRKSNVVPVSDEELLATHDSTTDSVVLHPLLLKGAVQSLCPAGFVSTTEQQTCATWGRVNKLLLTAEHNHEQAVNKRHTRYTSSKSRFNQRQQQQLHSLRQHLAAIKQQNQQLVTQNNLHHLSQHSNDSTYETELKRRKIERALILRVKRGLDQLAIAA